MPFLPWSEKFDFSVPCGPEESKWLVESRLALDKKRRLVSTDLCLEVVIDDGSSSALARAKSLFTPKATLEFKGSPGATNIYCTIGVDQKAEPTMNKIAIMVVPPFCFYVIIEKSLRNYLWSDTVQMVVVLYFVSFGVLVLLISIRAMVLQYVDSARYRALLNEIIGELKSEK